MTRVHITHSDFPWVVTVDRKRTITDTWRSEMFAWLIENFGKDSFSAVDSGMAFEILRFRNREDAALFKLKWEGRP